MKKKGSVTKTKVKKVKIFQYVKHALDFIDELAKKKPPSSGHLHAITKKHPKTGNPTYDWEVSWEELVEGPIL